MVPVWYNSDMIPEPPPNYDYRSFRIPMEPDIRAYWEANAIHMTFSEWIDMMPHEELFVVGEACGFARKTSSGLWLRGELKRVPFARKLWENIYRGL